MTVGGRSIYEYLLIYLIGVQTNNIIIFFSLKGTRVYPLIKQKWFCFAIGNKQNKINSFQSMEKGKTALLTQNTILTHQNSG